MAHALHHIQRDPLCPVGSGRFGLNQAIKLERRPAYNLTANGQEEDAHVFKPPKWFVPLRDFVVALIRKREGVYRTDVLHGIKGCRSYKLRASRSEVPGQKTPRLYGETNFKAVPTGLHLRGFLMRENLGMNPGQRLPGITV